MLNDIQNSILRTQTLMNFDVDFQELSIDFENLINIAQNIAGTDVSLFNLIDAHHQFTFSNIGFKNGINVLEDMPCQYTVLEENYLEIRDLNNHQTLKNKDYVINSPYLNYYFGLPLKTSEGQNIGTICFLSKENAEINSHQIQLLKLVAKESVLKIESLRNRNILINQFFEYKAVHRKVANDLRNPLAGIIGLSDVLIEQIDNLDNDEVKQYNELINNSSKSILEIIDQVIISQKKQDFSENSTNLKSFADELLENYIPLLASKNIKLDISVNEVKADILFLKNHVNNLVGSLLLEISRLINENASLTVELDLIIKVDQQFLQVVFTSDYSINTLEIEQNQSIKFYADKIDTLGGKLTIDSENNGLFQIIIPVKNV